MADSTVSGYRPPEASGVPRPVRRSPLDAYAAAFSRLGPRLRVVERPFRGMLDLRFEQDTPDWSFDGIPLPGPLTATGTPEQGLLWLGPGWFLLVLGKLPGPNGRHPLGTQVEERGSGSDSPVSVVDVSAWRTIVDLAGPRVLPVLRTGCSLDLRPEVFAPGACAQTLLARSPIVLQRLPDEQLESAMRPGYRLFVRSSYAQHFATWLLDAAGGPA